MNTTFDYTKVPYGFAHCLNSQCPRAKECLRHLAAQHIPNDCKTIKIVAPTYASIHDKECPLFMSKTKIQLARGITHLLDKIPHEDAVVIKQKMLNHFGHNLYYRLWRKERLFTPQQQNYISRLFKSRGIEAPPMYDEIIEDYTW